jgi:hypothetical protein
LSTVEKISGRELAKRLKVSEGAVRQAIARGDLGKAYDSADKKIDYNKAIKTGWAQSQLNIKPKAGVSRTKAVEKLEQKETAPKAKPVEQPPPPFKPDEDDAIDDELLNASTKDLSKAIKINSNLKTAEAMRRREIIALALDKKKLEEAEGILVRRDKVEKALFTLGSELKKSLFTMPQRIIRDIMAAPNEVDAINIMNDELTLILNTYGNLKPNSLS